MNSILKYMLVAIAMLLITSCSEEYLDTYPTDSISPQITFSSIEGVEGAVNGIAKLMNMQYSDYGQGFNGEGTVKLYTGEYPGNNFAKPFYRSQNPLFNMLYHERNTSKHCHFAWTYYYKIISNANLVIENIELIEEATKAQKEFYKAQALTFRAYAYSQLVQIYSNRWKGTGGNVNGVVLRLSSSIEGMGLSTLKEVYAQIYEDLDEAIVGFEASGMTPPKRFLPGLTAAHAVYARAALNREDYQVAINHAQKAKQGHPLMTNADYKAGFAEPNDEWIWYCYGALDETLFYYSYGAYLAYNGNSSRARQYRSCITAELINRIPNTDVRKSIFIHPTLWADSDLDTEGYQNENGFTQDWDIKDKELVDQSFNTVLSPASGGSKSKMYDEIISYIASNGAYFDLYPKKAYTTIYEHIKFAHFGAVGESNINLFRSSEMVLIEAEANYFLGNTDKAQAALVELNASSGRDSKYTCNKEGNELFDEIRTYRGLELWGEGYDWFDMKRWGLPIKRLSIADGGSYHATQAIEIQPDAANNWTWLIPLVEIDQNDGLSQGGN